MKVGNVIPSLFLFLSLFCEWMGFGGMGQTNTTFMEMASCALKSNGAAGGGMEAQEAGRERRRRRGKKAPTKPNLFQVRITSFVKCVETK